MTAIIPLTAGAALPSYLANRAALATINDELVTTSRGYPVLSIKGKVFTLVKDGERKVLTKPDDPEEVLQTVEAVVVRANTKARVFYAKAYTEGDQGETAKPDCYSNNGVEPEADSRNRQAAKCAVCPHAVWGTGQNGKGTACSVHDRLAIVDPHHIGAEGSEPYLLRVPAGSRANFAEIVKTAKSRGIPYNALALKMGFDREAATPKLTFRIVGLLDDASYQRVQALYADETVLEIAGLAPAAAAPAAPALAAPAQPSVEDDLDAALAARAAAPAPAPKRAAPEASLDELDAAMAAPAAAPAPKPAAPKVEAEPVEAPKPRAKRAAPAPAPAAATTQDYDDLLGGLDALLGATDD